MPPPRACSPDRSSRCSPPRWRSSGRWDRAPPSRRRSRRPVLRRTPPARASRSAPSPLQLAMRPVVGWASDRYGRRPLLLAGAPSRRSPSSAICGSTAFRRSWGSARFRRRRSAVPGRGHRRRRRFAPSERRGEAINLLARAVHRHRRRSTDRRSDPRSRGLRCRVDRRRGDSRRQHRPCGGRAGDGTGRRVRSTRWRSAVPPGGRVPRRAAVHRGDRDGCLLRVPAAPRRAGGSRRRRVAIRDLRRAGRRAADLGS